MHPLRQDGPVSSIRPYRTTDRSDVAEICIRTAAAGKDATGVYSDDNLLSDIWVLPYVDLEPDLAFVVDNGERAAGYVVGVADTRAFIERYRTEWLPRYAEKYGDLAETERDGGMVKLGLDPDRMAIPEVDEYPAHLHIDLLPELQRQGFGRKLIATLLAALRERGVPGLHLGVASDNDDGRAFYSRLGFIELPSSTPQSPVYGIRTDALV
jgi:ribosomal protein S18 acetylase RimI-like enzyme